MGMHLRVCHAWQDSPTPKKGAEMKSLHDLARTMLTDVGMACGINTARDWKTVACRLEHEGDEFLTITLPSYAKDFERSLELGVVADDLFRSFRKQAGLPVFMRGFLLQVFEPGAATVKTDASIQAIFAIRQFCLAFGKILALPSPRRQRAALRAFVQLEEEMILNGQAGPKERSDDEPSLESVGCRHDCCRGSSGGNDNHPGDLHGLAGVSRRLVQRVSSTDWGTPDFQGMGVGCEVCASEVHGTNVDDSGRHCLCLRPECKLGHDRHPCSVLQLVHRNAELLRVDGINLVSMHLCGGPVHLASRSLLGGTASEDGLPQHGPGKTADRLVGNAKYRLGIWPERLERCFPATSWNATAESTRVRASVRQRVSSPPPNEELPTRVILVPKSSKTPRIIAAELTAHQWIQQALSKALVRSIEQDMLFGPLIGFSDQLPNQEMAREGSLTGELATLDLSEASDRVSLSHVRRLLQYNPDFLQDVLSCRALRASVPGYGVIPLAKFATMGSALTFPIEAMVFLTIVVASIARVDGVRPTAQFIRGLHGQVRIYGDDIIVPSRYATTVISDLEAEGLKVNANKSFWNGHFRESCGGDFFLGQGVKPVRLRKPIPRSRRDTAEIASLVSFRNQCYEAGLWTTAAWCDKVIYRLIRYFPITESTSSLLGRRSYVFSPMAEDVCRDTHVPLVKGVELRDTIPASPLDGYPALTKWHFAKARRPGSEPAFPAKDHLQYAGRPVRPAKLVTRMRRPY